LTDEQIRARLAERGDLPTDLDVQLLRWTKAENTRRTPYTRQSNAQKGGQS
jgi:hypothetical protein